MSKVLSDYFDYSNGNLIWKERDSSFPLYRNGWNGKNAGKVAGTKDSSGYVRVRLNGEKTLAHVIIWKIHNGPISDGMEIDHINGIRHDNRIENLRVVTKSANQRNRVKLNKNNTSGVSGVYWCNTRSCWMAHKRLQDATIQKRFNTLEEAAAAIKEFYAEHSIRTSK